MKIPKVLLVDDMSTIRAFVRGLLKPMGWQLVEAADGRAALDICSRAAPDLVLSDVRMPGMSGIEFCYALKATDAGSHIPVVFLSGEKDAATREQGLAAGAAAFLKKPINSDELEQTLRQLIETTPRFQRRPHR